MSDSVIFDPLPINKVVFNNRILRSSVGGRTCNYDGTVTDVWKNFEKRFADNGVGGIISTTFHVNKDRLSPPQYPSIADGKYVPYLKKYIPKIRRDGECKYIVQIGDPGYTTYSSLFPEDRDAVSSSSGFDGAFGYSNTRREMSEKEIQTSIAEFVAAAGRVSETGADGIEITATKGYLIHQFLNPGINRRNDAWGGDAQRRFHFLERIVEDVRNKVGPDYLFGIRLSAADFNYNPVLLAIFRSPWPFLSRELRLGNELPQMLEYGRKLKDLKVDYLHVVSGYGFPNPRDVPGQFPFDEIRMFFDSVRHLSLKAAVRAAAVHFPPDFLMRWLLNLGWHFKPAINLEFAREFKRHVGLPVITNGGFQDRTLIESALSESEHGRLDACDLVSMARPLIANCDLVEQFRRGINVPDRACTHCNKCVGRTTTSPLGCYDISRFDGSQEKMVKEILKWNRADPASDDCEAAREAA